MAFAQRYRQLSELPDVIPVFPLGGALLLPRGQMPLNIFEPRYLKMFDDALSGQRLIGMVQPDGEAAIAASGNPAMKPPLCSVGCVGRITSYAETPDSRLLITLTGIARFRITDELETTTPYRQCHVSWKEFENDLLPDHGGDKVSRDKLLAILKQYLDKNGMQADWRSIEASSNEQLVNSLSMISPYGPREKQALLEAASLEDRNQILIALTEMALTPRSSDTPMQ